MDTIYGGAALTIIAASGTDASSGVFGVRGTPQRRKTSMKIGLHEFNVCRGIRDEIRVSRWNNRGWTYQEGILSRRTLIFTETRVCFECSRGRYIEGHDDSLEEMSPETYLDADLGGMSEQSDNASRVFARPYLGATIDEIYNRLIEYFPRKLSYGSDSLAAFEGVLNAFSIYRDEHSPAKHLYGIPFDHGIQPWYGVSSPTTESFIRGLAWFLESPAPSEHHVSTVTHHGTYFPSWTWA